MGKHGRRRAVGAEFLYAFAARFATVLIEIPNSNAISFCVMPRALSSSVAHSRAVSGRACDTGERLTSSGPTPVVPPTSTRWPTGAARGQGAYCAHPGQAPPHRGTRAASRRSHHHERQRSSRDRLMWRRAGCRQNCRQRGIVDLPSRAESAHFVRRGRDSNPREPCDSSGFQDRRIRPLCHPSEAMITRLFDSRRTRGGSHCCQACCLAPLITLRTEPHPSLAPRHAGAMARRGSTCPR